MTKKKVAGPKKQTKAEKAEHDRKITAGEAERIEKGRRLAASYLVERDGMDAEIARMIVDGMEPEAINDLISEANTAVIEKTKKAGKGEDGPSPFPVAADTEGPPPSFVTIPVLAAAENFVEMVQHAVYLAQTKNESEKNYKQLKASIMYLMAEAKVRRVEAAGVNLTVYPGSTRTLSVVKLIEKGVSMDVINQCYDETPWTDVRLTVVKG